MCFFRAGAGASPARREVARKAEGQELVVLGHEMLLRSHSRDSLIRSDVGRNRGAAVPSAGIETRSDDDEGRVHRRDEAVRLLVDRLGGGGSRRECQERTKGALLETLEMTLREALELNRREAVDAAGEARSEPGNLPFMASRADMPS